MSKLSIKQIPALRDNYMYLLTCETSGKTAIVDPAEHAPVVETLGGQNLDYILNTHHHWDHTDGNLALKEKYNATIIGSGYDPERIRGLDQQVKEGDSLKVGEAEADVIFVPGHTRGHIAFYFPESHALFCGDTLFAGGCGRMFEGTPEEMFSSLQKLSVLPAETKVYCGHEYTEANYKFAQQATPENTDIQKRLKEVQTMRAYGKSTVPSTMAEETRSNVFLLAKTPEAFAELREQKDNF